jgi:signal transduction histidine kinase
VSGIRIKNVVLLTRQALFILGLVASASAAAAYVRTHKPLRAAAATEHQLARNVGRIMTLDELLTMSARMAASSRDHAYEERYLANVDELDQLIKTTLALVPDEEVASAVRSTEEANDRLVGMEMRSFELDNAGRYEEAAKLVASDAYRTDKGVYAAGMRQAFTRLESVTAERTASVERRAIWLQLAGVASLAVMLAAWTLERRTRWREAAAHAEELTATVERRTAELGVAHAKLVTAARIAGMAEVAAGVLHNVGNVLNSVNVSASLIDSKVRASRAADLVKVTALLKANERDVGSYLSSDSKGKLLPRFLISLAEHMTGDQAELVAEIGTMNKSLDHIKQIVSAHQSYARPSSMAEKVDPIEVMEEALRIGGEGRGSSKLCVSRSYGELLPLTTDKHRLLQIMVNLVKNACAALDTTATEERLLAVTVDRAHDNPAKLIMQVKDNGAGIAPEIMPRLFEHGFTTKETGSGFGLHTSALAARALGGSIHARSDGRGTGATFTVSLPMDTIGAELL